MADPPALAPLPALPGEPDPRPPAAPIFLLLIGLRAALVLAWSVILAPLWIAYAAGRLRWGHPPAVVRPRRVWLYLGHALRPTTPAVPVLIRLWVILGIVRRGASIPLWSLAWMLDEVLYGRALDAVEVEAPLFHMSAGRSGSTRMGRVLDADPQLVGPNMLQCVFPYLWLWRIARRLFGTQETVDRLRAMALSRVNAAFLQRHEMDPFAVDTFDAALFVLHLNAYSPYLGAAVMRTDFAMGHAVPHNAHLWHVAMPALVDRLARKTLLFAGPAADGKPRRFFLKGHFLAAAEALEARFPDARFLAVVRPPTPRLRSMINFLRVSPVEPVLGWPPWSTVAPALRGAEAEYCHRELHWFTAEGPAVRCVVPFDAFIGDLPGTMDRVYAACFGTPPPPELPEAHAPRRRDDYLVDRTLEQMGVDAAAYRAELADYGAWLERLGGPA